MAASRSGSARSTITRSGIPGAPPRTSFAKIREPLEVPNLLALQTESFDWLVGNDLWRARVSSGASVAQSGLEEILTELSPIEDFSGSMSLSFSNPRFEDVKASIDECKDKDMTYAAPLFVTAEFTNNTTGEIKSQTVFMGDFPMMTRKGTFIINGTERVVVSRSSSGPPASTSDRTLDKVTDRRGLRRQGHSGPRRVAGVRGRTSVRPGRRAAFDRKRRQPVTVLLQARWAGTTRTASSSTSRGPSSTRCA